MMGGLQTLVLMGGLKVPPPPFLFVKTIEKVIRLCTVLKKNYLIGSFKDKAIFHVISETKVKSFIIQSLILSISDGQTYRHTNLLSTNGPTDGHS